MNRNLILGIVASSAVHVLWLVGAARASGTPPVSQAPTEIEIAVDQVPEPPETAPAKEAPPEPSAVPEPAAPVQRATAQQQQAPSQAPQAAAQAAQTITAPESDTKGDDRADFTMVQGNGATYAGGTTAAEGTSTSAVRGPASPTGTGTAPVAAAAPPPAPKATSSVDLSRGALPASNDWNCSALFPNDPEAGNSATAIIVVTVRPDGTPRSVSVLTDPGHGFGGAARACALGQRYSPALDKEGHPTTASTPPITVRFLR